MALAGFIDVSFLNTSNKSTPFPNDQIFHEEFPIDNADLLHFYLGQLLNFNDKVIRKVVQANQKHDLVIFFVCLPKTKSRGTIQLSSSSDPLAPPIIRPNYLTHKNDADKFVEV